MASLKLEGSSTTPLAPERIGFPTTAWWSGVAVSAAIVCAGLAVRWPAWSTAALIVALSSLVGWADVRWRRIPNPVVIVAGMFAGGVAIVWDDVSLVAVAVGAALTCAPALVLHLMNPRWVGFGDVKLLAALGALFSLLWVPAGIAVLWLAMLLALVCHAFVPAAWRSAVPFGFWLSLVATPFAMFLAGSIVS